MWGLDATAPPYFASEFRRVTDTESSAAALGVDGGTHSRESVAKPSVVALSRSWLQKYGTVYHQVWHHRQVWKFSSLAWKLSYFRDAIWILSWLTLTYCAHLSRVHKIDCMVRVLEVSWLYVTLIAIVFIIILLSDPLWAGSPSYCLSPVIRSIIGRTSGPK